MGAEALEVNQITVAITPTGPLIGKTWTFTSNMPLFPPSDYLFISATQIEVNPDPDNEDPPTFLSYQYQTLSTNEAILTFIHPTGARLTSEITFRPDAGHLADYDLSNEDESFTDTGRVTE